MALTSDILEFWSLSSHTCKKNILTAYTFYRLVMHACARGSSANAERFPHQHTADTWEIFTQVPLCVNSSRRHRKSSHENHRPHFQQSKMKNSRVSEDISSKIPICQMQSHKVDEISIKIKSRSL